MLRILIILGLKWFQTDAVKTVGYSLFDVYSENIMTGVRASVDNGLGIIYNETSDNKGFIFIGRMRGFVKSSIRPK